MKNKKQLGFSLMELLVAMMIMAVLATIGIKKYQEFSANARYIQANATVKTVSEGLDQYFLKHGKYPELTSFESMVEPNSPMVKENMLPVGMSGLDPWGVPFEGKSGKGTYELKCGGDPNVSPDRPPFSVEPGKIQSAPGATVPNPDAKGPAK